jgi:hypothetical protein
MHTKFLSENLNGMTGHLMEDNVKIDIRGIGCEDVEWIELDYDRVHWRDFVNTAIEKISRLPATGFAPQSC